MSNESSMMPVHPGDVVVAVDGSEPGYTAVAYAAREARRLRVPLDVVHVSPVAYPIVGPMMMVPYEAVRTVGTEVLEIAKKSALETAPGLDVTTHLLLGSRVPQLIELSERAGLMVFGSRRPGGLDRMWTGGTVTGVASRAACPVIVVPADWKPALRHGRIVVGFKSPTHADELLAASYALAEALDSEVVVLHAWRLQGVYDDIIADRVEVERWQRDETEVIEKCLVDPRESFPNVRTRVFIRHEDPVHALVRASCGADRLVIMRPAHGGLLHHLGHTARGVLREAHCPIEVLAPMKGGQEPQVPSVAWQTGELVR